MNFLDYPDADMMMLSLARLMARQVRAALDRRDRAVLSVPGGSTPGPVFDMLSAVDLEWDRVDIIPGDERWVPEGDPRSNAGQIRARLMRDKAAPARLVPLWRPLPAPQDAADAVAADIEPRLPIDVALVGMGADMHTASLFPGAETLPRALAEDAPAVVPISAPGAAAPRITLSARVLRDAYDLHVLITGDEKRAALEIARKSDPMTAPIRALLGTATVHWAP